MEHLAHKSVWFPSAVKIAGVMLMPPTLGQWRLLEAVNSPFALADGARAEDVAVALALLRLPWRTGRWLLARGRLFGLAAGWIGRRASLADAALLDEWLRCVWSSPERFVADGEKGGNSFPPCCGLAARYALRCIRLSAERYSFREILTVWDLTVPEALFTCTVAAELDGAEFESREEAEANEDAET